MATEKKGLLAKYHDMLQEKLEGRRGDFVYRGQKCAEWELQSGAVSRIGDKPIQTRTLVEYHNALLESVRLRGWNRDFSGRKLNDLELLAKLQHHGAATCLLDFTTRFDIALWFACQEVGKQEVEEKEKDKDESRKGRIFIVAINQYTQSGLGKVSSKKLKKPISYFLRSNLQSIKGESREDSKKQKKDGEARRLKGEENRIRFWYWEPETLMGRMLSQESRFLFGPQDIPKSNYLYIDIEEGHKEGLLKELRQQQGLRPETVFSDIHGFADINARGKPWKVKSYENCMQAGMSKLQKHDELANAVKDFERAIELEPGSTDAWFYSGVAKERMGMHAEAIKNFDEAIKLDANFVTAWLHRGRAKIELEQHEDAIADYDEAIKLDAGLVSAWFYRGWAKIESERYEDAVTDYDEAIRLDAGFSVAWCARGLAKIELSRYEDAVADYDEAIRLDADFSVVWFHRGQAKMKLSRYEDAVADYDEAIRLDADFAGTWFHRGQAKMKLERYEDAVTDYDEAIRLDADFAGIWLCRGQAKMKLERYEDAVTDYDEAIRLDASLAVAWHYRGLSKMKLERYEDAVTDYDEAIRLNADFAFAWYGRGLVKMELKRYEEANSDMKKSLVLFQSQGNQEWQKRVKKNIEKLDKLLKEKDGSSDS